MERWECFPASQKKAHFDFFGGFGVYGRLQQPLLLNGAIQGEITAKNWSNPAPCPTAAGKIWVVLKEMAEDFRDWGRKRGRGFVERVQ